MRKTTQPLRTALAGTTLLALITTANGAGFQLAERSAIGMGRAYSGEAAIADDASVIASNPAGMSLLDDMSFSIGASYIRSEIDVSGVGATGPTSDKSVIPQAVIPHTYFSKRINDKITIGAGTFVGYGLKSDYSTDFATSAATDYSELTTVNFNPAISYRVNDQLSLGAGFNVMYAKGNITSLTPGAGTNLFDLEGDDIAFGYNVGILYEFSDRTRVGLHYRSSIDLGIEGESDLGALLGGGSNIPTTLDVSLPDTIEFSIYHEITDRFAVHGDILWTGWSKFEELAPITGTAAIDSQLLVDESWDDTFRFSIGATYIVNDKLTLRCGVALDESPVDDAHRTLRIPDSDRIWASVGASYVINECYTCDIGFTHIVADEVQIDQNEDFFNGEVSGYVNLLSVGVHGSF